MRPSRRTSAGVLALAFAVVAGACDAGGGDAMHGGRSLASLVEGATQVGLFAGQGTVPTGRARLSFGLVTQDGGLVSGGSPEVWLARSQREEPVGPFRATPYQFEHRFHNNAPRTDLVSFYVADVDVPSPGTWTVAATVQGGGRRLAGTASISTDAPASPSAEAFSVIRPVGAVAFKIAMQRPRKARRSEA